MGSGIRVVGQQLSLEKLVLDLTWAELLHLIQPALLHEAQHQVREARGPDVEHPQGPDAQQPESYHQTVVQPLGRETIPQDLGHQAVDGILDLPGGQGQKPESDRVRHG